VRYAHMPYVKRWHKKAAVRIGTAALGRERGGAQAASCIGEGVPGAWPSLAGSA
jgi:hypothetical protein